MALFTLLVSPRTYALPVPANGESMIVHKFVSYYRVSTEKQGKSGLGLDAQREAVCQFLDRGMGIIIAEFVEIESGGKNDRPELAAALAECQRSKATLIIAKLDRLARSVAFIANLMERNVDFVACDMPEASRLLLHVMAAFAEHERRVIGERTKAALAAAKARGVRLGTNGVRLAAQRKSAATEYACSIERNMRAAREGGARTMREVAEHLNTLGLRSREGGRWHPASVSRIMKRIDALDAAPGSAV